MKAARKIIDLSAREILDSRGRPTVAASLVLADGSRGSVSVPSGASTGAGEAHELRDGDPQRYGGLGCRRAAASVNEVMRPALCGKAFATQAGLDQTLLELDGTARKSVLGANAILAVSLAFARAAAAADAIPLYAGLAQLVAGPRQLLPRPTINLFSGGKHAGGQVAIQDVLVVPASAATIDEAMAMTYAVYQAAAKLCAERYNARPLSADEGGLAPPAASAEALLADAVAAIEAAGYTPGHDVALAVDVAASHFISGDGYRLDGRQLTAAELIETIADWVQRYPIVSVEDGLHEDDWANWPALRARLAPQTLVLGDDLLCTNPQRIQRAIDAKAADALLLKVNQIGTLTEAATARGLAVDAGWQVTVSARSGETEDDWLADLAVGWGADQLKVGSITQSERLAKYNRLLAIEADAQLALNPWPNS